jgi:hypothetical protein
MFQTRVVEKLKTHILCSTTFSENTVFYEIKLKKYGRARQELDENITRRIRYACWITEVTNTHCEYVILITFPRQRWLRECIIVLHCLSFLMTFYGSAQKEVQRLPVFYFQCLRFLEDD